MAEDTKEIEKKDKEVPESTRRKYRNDAWTEEQVAARKAELTQEAPPEGWVKLSEVSKLCRAESIPVSKFVRATGGDRGMNPPLDPLFQIVYVGRTRYLHPDVLTKGIELLKTEGFATTPRKPRAKKEKATDGTGPVKGAKSGEKKRVSTKRPDVNPGEVWEAQ